MFSKQRVMLVCLFPALAFGQFAITGTVKRADNSAIQGLTVVIENGGSPITQFVTDASGNYALSAPAGSYTQLRVRNLGATIDGLPKQIEHTAATSITITKDTVIDIKMPAYAKIYGRILSSMGDTIKNAEVRAKRWVFGAEQPPWDWTYSSATDGSYAVYQDTGASRIWVVPPAGLGVGSATFDLTIKKDTLINLIMPKICYLSGYVFSNRGDTLKGIGVAIELGGGQQVDSTTNIITGLYKIPLNPGTCNVRLRNQGSNLPGIPRTIEATVVTAMNFSRDSTLNLTLPLYPAIVCSVVNQSGAPVVNATVRSKKWVFGAEQPPWDWDSTNSAGLCTLYVSPDSNKYWIDPSAGSNLISSTIVVKTTKDTTLKIIMNQGVTLSGTIRRFDNSVVAGITVAIEKEADYKYAQTDLTGAYSIQLQPATYRLRVRNMNTQIQGIPQTLEHTVMDTMILSADRQINIVLPIFPAITGIVRDPAGNPISGVTILAKRWVNGAEQPPWANCLTGGDGAYSLVVGKGINRVWVTPVSGLLAAFDFIEAFDTSKTRDIYVAEQARGIKRIQPSVVSTGQSGMITITGVNCNFASTPTLNLGDGITVTNIKVVSGITLTADIAVADNAKPGNRDARATVSGAAIVGPSLLTITPPASDALNLDNQGKTVDTVVISDGTGTTLVIPKGTAVTLPAGSDSMVSFVAPIIKDTATRPSSGDFVEVQRELKPTGLVFKDTVALIASYKAQDVEGISETTLKPFYFTDGANASGGAVVGDSMKIIKRDTAGNTLTFGMTHFSMFRLAGRGASVNLRPNHPRPVSGAMRLFAPQTFGPGYTALRFYVDAAHASIPIRLSIFDLHGRVIAAVFEGIIGEGTQTVLWEGRSAVANAVLICRLTAGNNHEEIRFIAVR